MSALFKCCVTLLAASLTIISPLATADVLQGRVVAVADGDTLTVLDENKHQHRVRLAEIDAPEKGQPFGSRSKQHLSDLCFGRSAEVEISDFDRYGRAVGKVYCDGVDANADLVRVGLAWVYVQYARRGSPLFDLEQRARGANIGLWTDANPTSPWQWRKGGRAAETVQPAQVASAKGNVRGNRRSSVYHLPHCLSYDAISAGNRVPFHSEQEAITAGYRRAGNCR